MASHANQQKTRAAWISALVALFLAAILALVYRLEQSRQEERYRADVAEQALTLAAQIESELNADVFLANGLAALAVAAPELSSASIQSVLKTLHDNSRHLKNIGLAPGNRITHLYPLKGNEKALGLYYPDVADQWPAVKAAMERHTTVLAGPLPLRQGGVGLISRTPVFLADGRYWGMLSLVLDADALLAQAQQSANKLGLSIALRGKDGLGERGDLFYGPASLFEAGSVLLTIRVPGGSWQLAVLPVDGWTPNISRQLLWAALGLATCCLAGLSMYLYLVGRARINTSERRLRAFLNTTPDGVIVISAKGEIEEFNPGAEAMFGYAAAEIVGQSVNRLMQAEDAQQHDSHIRHANQAAARTMAVGREIHGRRKDGSVFPIEVKVADTHVEGRLVHVGVLRDITERKTTERQLHDLARLDSLTGVANRRALMDMLDEAWAWSQRHQSPLSVLMIDADHFKSINDTYGHHVGDLVLVHLAQVCLSCLREVDRFGRFGGEEFLAVVPETEREQAETVAARLVREVATSVIAVSGVQGLKLTISVGVASVGPEVASVHQLVQQADAALYRAKSLGRNRYV